MADLKLNSSGGGSVTLTTPSTASNLTLTLPAATSTLLDTTSTQTLTNKTLTAAGSNTVEATSGPTSTQLAGNRNKIINGAMMIDQRNAGASVTPNGSYTLDRWLGQNSQTGKYTVQQNAGSVTPPVGFTNYLGITSASAYSVIASDYFFVCQRIEGYNFQDLAWGTANAKTVTLSFQVYSSLTGTFGGSINANGNVRCYPFSYTISSANTWTTVSIVIPGDTTVSSSWLTGTNNGANIIFGLGVGSSNSGTAGAWSGTQYFAPTGATSVVGTNGATFYITGVQLEKGATATPFENRLYGAELALCQRYYYLHVTGSGKEISLGSYYSTTQIEGYIQFPVTMRSAPSGVSSSGTDYFLAFRAGGSDGFNSMNVPTETSTTCAKWFNASEASGVAGNVANVVTNNASAYLAFSSEL